MATMSIKSGWPPNRNLEKPEICQFCIEFFDAAAN